MGLFTGFLMTVMTWWIVFLAVLPLKGNPSKTTEKGNTPSAPRFTYLKPKIILTSVITAVVMVIVWLCVKYQVINLDNL